MNTEIILRLLSNSGLHVRGIDSAYIYLEDPACIIRSFETFVEYAWMFITIVTGLMLFGWALSMIRGAKNDIFSNLKDMIMIFGVLSLAVPIINFIYGDDLFARGCRTIKVPLSEVEEILAARQDKLASYNENDLYEDFDIYDSGATGAEPAIVPQPTEHTPESTAPTSSDVAPQSADGTAPVSASEAGRNVIYHYRDNRKKTHIDGTRAWRNTNAGNIRSSEFATKNGAIGRAGGFAVFPDEDTGMRAIKQLMQSKSYINLTVAGAISRYAPPAENDTAAYHRQIQKLTGLSINKPIRDLTDAELDKLARAIKQIEGWKAGQISYSN